nr:MAG TPA: hypothetical protein [Caudoviricetes sp.]
MLPNNKLLITIQQFNQTHCQAFVLTIILL